MCDEGATVRVACPAWTHQQTSQWQHHSRLSYSQRYRLWQPNLLHATEADQEVVVGSVVLAAEVILAGVPSLLQQLLLLSPELDGLGGRAITMFLQDHETRLLLVHQSTLPDLGRAIAIQGCKCMCAWQLYMYIDCH